MIQEFSDCYEWARDELKEVFDTTMAEMAVNIVEAQYLIEGCSFARAALILCLPPEHDENAEEIEERVYTHRMIKACIVWNAFTHPQYQKSLSNLNL
jgi:hypothetical protein